MKCAVRQHISVCLHPRHLRRTVAIALVVGTWLTLYNQGDALLSTAITAVLGGQIFLNYLTPFIVANWGLISREADQSD